MFVKAGRVGVHSGAGFYNRDEAHISNVDTQRNDAPIKRRARHADLRGGFRHVTVRRTQRVDQKATFEIAHRVFILLHAAAFRRRATLCIVRFRRNTARPVFGPITTPVANEARERTCVDPRVLR